MDLAQRLRDVVDLDPRADALWRDGGWWPWQVYGSVAGQLDAQFRDAGLGDATRVGVVMRNLPECAVALVALLMGGHCVVLLDPSLPDDRLRAEIGRSGVPVVLGTTADAGLGPAADAAGCLVLELAASDEGCQVRRLRAFGGGTGHRLSAPGVAVEMLTSGTTGPPKRVPLTYAAQAHELEGRVAYLRNDDGGVRLRGGVVVTSAPLVHSSGLQTMIHSVVEGRRMHLLKRFRIETWIAAVRRHRPRTVSLQPSAMRMVLDAGVPPADLASVRAVTTGAAPLDPDLKDEFERVYDVAVLNLYGATEFAGGVTGWTIRDWEQFRGDKRGSVGRANPGVRLRVVDERTREPVPAGEPGVLEVGSDRFDTVDWVPTSDLGRLDGDGFLWIVGRLDDVIIRGGFKIQAEDVRIALESHPAVREAAVVGIPDDRLGEVPVAVVVLTEAAAREDTVDGPALREHVRQRLTAYQVPVDIRVVRELPRTAALKVPKPAVRALFGSPS